MGDINFKKEFKRLKKQAKEYIYTNAAMYDEIQRTNEKICKTKEEKIYLLARLLQMESHFNALRKSNTNICNKKKRLKMKNNLDLDSINKEDIDDVHQVETYSKYGPAKSSKSLHQTLVKRASLAPLDASGRPIFPIELGSLTVFSIGEINPSVKYHTTKCIYPVGYCSTRLYLSIDPQSLTTLYTCKVTDDGGQPKFEILLEDDGQSFVGSNPDECHKELLDTINAARGALTVPTTSNGAEFFGLTHPTLQNLIQCFPGARKCPNYKWVKFEVTKNQSDVITDQDPSVNYSMLDLSGLSV